MSCNTAQDRRERLGLHAMLIGNGQQASCVSIYPSSLIPFLDSKVNEEAVLKTFLRTVHDMHFYALSNRQIMEDIYSRATEIRYVKTYDEDEGYRRMVLFVDAEKNKRIKSLVLLVGEDSKYYYCIEASGEMQEADIARLGKIRPDFFESYFKRFNIKF
ncbi:MAG: DUF4252 domain-containing protein [Prevotellaceae bacterium]|jgi:hypothetical protein|nr:DUF4252 domain-containing protein [Prevotellaceae bacterium]